MIIQYFGILRIWLFGPTKDIKKKKKKNEVWLVFQGNNDHRSGRLKQTRQETNIQFCVTYLASISGSLRMYIQYYVIINGPTIKT